jgi:UDP-4-amino-4,6-dideoxy-N-acetyl-beta-L-altrosamine N-acetyltransferase
VNSIDTVGQLREMVTDDIGQVLSWRNHLEIRRYMFTRHPISLDEHREWFASASQDHRRKLLIYLLNEKPMGFVQFSGLDDSAVADWGFYAAPNAPKGTGSGLGRAAMQYAFDVLKLHKVCAKVLAFNHSSILFHKKLLFQQEGVLRDQFFDGEAYHHVISLGLLQQEWRQSAK